ncbi:hypothetical protein [Flavobacterium soyae]|uniref:Uncharacterized protein n=1 Tax=Flavobacterium soyae TaxID=2903098 RepID=A0ABZ2UD06_9FLAO
MKNLYQDYEMLSPLLQAQLPKAKIETRYLPDFICASCGNCERNYHKDEASNENNGFCMKFFQNVPLEEKNVNCWTSKQHTYFEDLSKLRPAEKMKDLHIRNKRADQLKIELENNQLNLF